MRLRIQKTIPGVLNPALLCGLTSFAQAGGHYSVDDAAILDPTQCQFEGWIEREAKSKPHARTRRFRLSSRQLRAGLRPGEITHRWRIRSTANPQLKWATNINDRLSIGLAAALNFQNWAPRYAGTSLVISVSVRLTETLPSHLNVGRDFNHSAPDQPRAGIAFEWEPATRWVVIGERFRQGGTNVARAGVRYEPSAALSFDFSRTRELQSGGAGWWTVGVSWAFDRRRPRAIPLRLRPRVESTAPSAVPSNAQSR